MRAGFDLFSHKASLVPDADYALIRIHSVDERLSQLVMPIAPICFDHQRKMEKDGRKLWAGLQRQRGCPDDQGDGCLFISCNQALTSFRLAAVCFKRGDNGSMVIWPALLMNNWFTIVL